MSDNELKIKDSEFENAGTIVKSFGNLLNNGIGQYKICLEKIYNNAIMSGALHEALATYISYVNQLVDIPEQLGKKFSKMVETYISDIDKADRYLYEIGGSVVRDFSNEEYKKLISLLDDPWCSVTDGIDDWITGKLMKWFNSNDITNPKADIDACHKNLLDYNDATKKTIDDIFNDVKSIERTYGRSISGSVAGERDYYTSNFANSSLAFFSLRDVFKEMAALTEPGKGRFTVDNINSKLQSVFLKLKYYYDTTVSIICDDSDVTIEMIEEFALQYWAETFFSTFNSAINMFVADIGGKETVMMIIFNAFDIAEGQVVSQGEYEKMIIKEELMDMLDDMANSYVYSGSDEQTVIDDCKDFLKYVKKYGDKWYKYMNSHRDENGNLLLDGRTKEAKAFKKMLDSLGGAQEILKYGDDAIDVIAKIFTDYSKNLEILESFKNNCPDNSNMTECAEELEALYEKQLSGILTEAFEKIKEVGFDEAMSWLGDNIPPIKVVQTIKKIIGTVGEVTGIGEEAKNMYNAMIYQDMFYSSNSAYESALAKVQEAIKNGKNSGSEYTKLVDDLKNCFNLTKNILVKMFKAMAAASSGTKKSYYEYCASRAENASMVVDNTFTGKFEIMSFEEYTSF